MFKHFKPRLRFSLRALLVVMTIGSIVLGIVVYRAERQHKAVAWVQAHSGDLFYPLNPQGPSIPKWLFAALGEHYFSQPMAVAFHGVTPETDLTPLASLPGLQQVSFGRGHVTAAHLRQLSALPSLATVAISKGKIDDDTLAAVRALPQVKRLTLSGLRLNARATQSAFDQPQLHGLLFNHCELDLSQVGSCEELQHLKDLALQDVIGNKLDLGRLAPLPMLQVLELSAEWAPATYAAIARQPALEHLVLEGGELSLVTLDQVCESPRLTSLNIRCDYQAEVAQRLQTLPPRLKVVTSPLGKNRLKFDFDTGEWAAPVTTP